MKIPGGFDALIQCFRIRDYRLYVTGNVAHGLGIWLLRMAIGWLAWELARSTAWLGAVALAETAPALILGLFAGTIIDRFNFIHMMRLTQGLSATLAATLAVLTLAGTIDIWTLFFMTLVRGSLMSFARPSRMVLVHHLVGRDLLASALAVNSITHNGTRFIGPALGGVIIAGAGVGWGFVAASILIGLYTAILLILKIDIEPKKREPRSMIAETAEGLAYVMHHPGIRLQLLILVVMGITARPVADLLPGFAALVFSRGADGLAMLLAAHGIGATCAGVWVASRSAGLVGMTSLSLYSVLFTSIMLVAFASTDIFWLALGFSALLAAGMLILTVTSQTLIQSAVDPALRGRVVSVHGLVMIGVPSLGALAVGGLAEYIGLQLPILAGGGIFLIMWIVAWQHRRMLEGSLEAPPEPDPHPADAAPAPKPAE